jgi:hypothetical protein
MGIALLLSISMRKCNDDEKEIDLKILTALHIFSTLKYEDTPYMRRYCHV